MVLGFLVPVFLGNIVGCTALFTLISHAQVMNDHLSGFGAPPGLAESIESAGTILPHAVLCRECMIRPSTLV